MQEIIERLKEVKYSLQDELSNNDDFIEFFPESEAIIAIKNDQITEFIEYLDEIIEEFV